ncbi:hypothetical protein, partial [Salinispora arenicola]|uniref:hypothetical protein n=1 Tax=Salinispora arenicola TaxID=168697 RepID=UPI0027DCB9C1
MRITICTWDSIALVLFSARCRRGGWRLLPGWRQGRDVKSERPKPLCGLCVLPEHAGSCRDPRFSEERELTELRVAMVEQHPRRNLSELREVTVSTGCFEREDAAVAHLVGLRTALGLQGIGARIGFLTSSSVRHR